MSKVLVIFGATGNQGGSVLDHVINDPELSKIYRVRAVTRDKLSAKAQALTARGVEVVACDGDDKESLSRAFKGAHTVFALTVTNYAGAEGHSELYQGKNIVDTAIIEGVSFFVWSTLPNVSKLTMGKYTKVASFDAKAQVEEYIRQQPIRSAFYAPGSFMQNFATVMRPHPSPAQDGSYVITRPVASTASVPLVDIAGDTGKFVAAILADPDKFEGQIVCGATKLYTMSEQAQILSHATGKTVNYAQVSLETYRSFLPPNVVDELIEMMLYQEEYGYFGAETGEIIARSVQHARGKPVSFEVFLGENPLSFD